MPWTMTASVPGAAQREQGRLLTSGVSPQEGLCALESGPGQCALLGLAGQTPGPPRSAQLTLPAKPLLMLPQEKPLCLPAPERGRGGCSFLWAGEGLASLIPRGSAPLSLPEPRCMTVTKIKET